MWWGRAVTASAVLLLLFCGGLLLVVSSCSVVVLLLIPSLLLLSDALCLCIRRIQGGELTHAGVAQAEELGNRYRLLMYPGAHCDPPRTTTRAPLCIHAQSHTHTHTHAHTHTLTHAPTRKSPPPPHTHTTESTKDTLGMGLLRLQSTYRHDLKFYSSNEVCLCVYVCVSGCYVCVLCVCVRTWCCDASPRDRVVREDCVGSLYVSGCV